MDTLIKPDDTWLLWTVIVVGVAASIWLEQTYRWAARVSGPVLALGIAMLAANLKLMPPKAAVYETINTQLVPLALPLLLFRANVARIVRATGWLFVAFHVACLGTVVGAITAAVVLNERVPETAQAAGIMAASYTGGGVNFIAVASSYGTSGDITGPLLVADNFIMAGMFLALILICRSQWARRRFSHSHTADAVDSRQLAAEHWRRKEISLLDVAAALAVAVTIVAAARATQGLALLGLEHAGTGSSALAELAGNRYLHITLWSTAAASLVGRFLERIHGAEEMGAYLLYVFLFVIGLPADLWTVVTQVPMMFVFCVIIALTNLVVTFAAARLLRLNLEDAALAVNASLGGAPSAAALAISMGWSKLVLPGLLIGIWGYVIGTAIGLAVGEALKG